MSDNRFLLDEPRVSVASRTKPVSRKRQADDLRPKAVLRNKKATDFSPVALGLVAVSPGYRNANEFAVVS
jgi:hypothetical protein